jgi:regulator of protease activity HflC (stomatin/prohibitin superfamily)
MKKGIELDVLEKLSLGLMYQVSQNTAYIIERFGKYNKVSSAGLNFKIPFVDQIVKKRSLRIQQLDVRVSTKTKDNVFVDIVASVQYKVNNNKDSIYNSYYELENEEEQINSYVFDAVRSKIPDMDLDDVFNKKDEIAANIAEDLEETIQKFGFTLIKTLITDIDVEDRIVNAMNEIVASAREKEAAKEKAEAEKILMVKKAEAEAESKELQGKGIANQRKAIIEGFKQNVQNLSDINGVKPEEVLQLILITQYFDTLKDVSTGESNTIMLPASPSGFTDIADQMRNAMISADAVKK